MRNPALQAKTVSMTSYEHARMSNAGALAVEKALKFSAIRLVTPRTCVKGSKGDDRKACHEEREK